MELLSLRNAGIIAWSNSKRNNCLFATAENQQNGSSSGLLQIYGFDMMNKNSSSNCLGKSRYDKANFSSISWDVFGETTNYTYGVIAGGMANGALTLWDPNFIIQYSTQQHNNLDEIDLVGLLCEVQLANNPIYSVEFNPQKPNLIACGGDELIIADISEAIDNPNLFTPGETNIHEGSLITCVSWNKKISHILASTSDNGITSIWDLKVKQSIFNFSDNSDINTSRRVQVTWNPEIPTQLAVTYDDEKYPELQIWDLRNPQGPITSIPAHTKGIHNIDWCISDPSLILTAGRDNKICIWNYKTGEMVSENNSINEDIDQVIWSPKLPDIYSVSTTQSNAKVFTLNSDAHLETNLSNYAPKWLKPPVAARFSFDNRLIVFSEKMGSVMKEYHIADTNKDIEGLAADLEETLGSEDIVELCDKKMNSHKIDEKDKLEWGFIKAIKTDDANDLIKVLGYNKNDIIKQSEQYTGKTHRKKEEEAQTGAKVVRPTINFTKISEEEADNFFANLRAPKDKQDKRETKGINKVSVQDGVEKEHIITENFSKNINWNSGIEKLIKQNILVGNIEGAVDCALKCGRVAEALTLAYTLGPDFFLSTVKTHFTASKEPFLKGVIKNLAESDLEELIQSYSLNDWKECVALITTQAKSFEFRDLMNKLADRFTKERKDDIHAVVLYILAKNIEAAVEVYMNKYLSIPRNSKTRFEYMIRTFEKIVALRKACNIQYNWNNFDMLVYELAFALNTHGKSELAMGLLIMGDPKNLEISRLRDRIFNSRKDFAHIFPNSRFPYELENIPLKPVIKPKQIGKNDVAPTVNTGTKMIAGPVITKQPLTNIFKPDNKVTQGPPINAAINQIKSPPVNPALITNPINKPMPVTGPLTDDATIHQKKAENPYIAGPPMNTKQKFDMPPPPIANPIINKPITGQIVSPPKGNDAHTIAPPPINAPINQAKIVERPPISLPENKHVADKPIGKTITPPNPVLNKTNPPISAETNQPNQPISNPIMNRPPPVNMGMGIQPQAKEIQQPQIPIKNNGPIMRQPGPVPKPTITQPNLVQPLINQPPIATTGNVITGPPKQLPVQNRMVVNPINKIPGPTITPNISSVSSLGNNPKQVQEIFDVSQIPAIYKSIVDTILGLVPMLDQIEKNAKKKADAESKLNQLFVALTASSLNANIVKNLSQLCLELDKNNESGALFYYQNITKDDDWNNNKDWLMVLKRLITKK